MSINLRIQGKSKQVSFASNGALRDFCQIKSSAVCHQVHLKSEYSGSSCSTLPVVTLLLLPTLAFAQTSQFTPPTSWIAQNSYFEAATGTHRQNYRERDISVLTVDGTLDTEVGNQKTISVALRWQFETGWLLHLRGIRQSGITYYNGYLQAGNTLTPYAALSGNTATQYGMTIGYALNASTLDLIPEHWQVSPLLYYSQHHWQRNLVQYGETYDHATRALGVLLQWQPRLGTVLEVQTLQGESRPARVSVPTLNFAATQPGGSFSEWQLAVSQDASALTGTESLKHWRITARYINSRYDHAASPVVNGLQAPPNQHSSSSWMVGMQRQF